MEPPRHSLVTYALVAAAALGAPAGAAHASTGCAALHAPPPAPAALLAIAPAVSTSAPSLPDAAPAGPAAAAPLAASPPAPVQVQAAPAAPLPPAAPPAGARTVKVSLPLEVEVHGRVLMDVSADERNAWGRTLQLGSARLGLEARLPGMKTVVEADLTSSPLLVDAYVRLDGPGATRLTAGRFKAPFSERRLESSWRLPLVSRGLVDHYLVKQNGLAGRRLGIAGTLRPWGGRLDATAGIFAGDPDALGVKSEAGEDLAARVAVSTGRALELGLSGYHAGSGTGPAAVPARRAGSAFASLDLGPLEAAVEGYVGRLAEGPFTAGTALVGWTFRAGATRRLRVTPVAGAEALRLRGATSGAGYGAIAGAVLSWTEGLKVKLQGEWARRPGDASPATEIAAEVGTRF